jgi:hypothetical protein
MTLIKFHLCLFQKSDFEKVLINKQFCHKILFANLTERKQTTDYQYQTETDTLITIKHMFCTSMSGCSFAS